MNFAVLRMTLATLTVFFPLVANAHWVANGRDAMLTMSLPQAKKPDTSAVITVSYEKRWSCRAAVSVLLVSGRTLGTPVRQDTFTKRDDQLSITVDGSVFTAETKATLYTNGWEFAIFAPLGLVGALKKARSVIARPGSGMGVGGFDFSDGTGFEAANATALANCN
ncbi:MAG: hypothetical protein ABI547_06710 [Betaproteobacteria bacterium]